MIKVEKTKATTPAITELESRVNKTFIPTLPHNIVVNRKFESSLNLAIFKACLLLFFDSISRRSLLMLKKARFKPENMAD
jgi:hypothetical protein